MVGAEIVAGTQTAVDNETWQVPTIRIEAGAELHLRETKRTKGKDTPLTLVAEPTVEVEEADGAQLILTVYGWHQFNPVTGDADFVFAREKNVRMWLLDTRLRRARLLRSSHSPEPEAPGSAQSQGAAGHPACQR